MRIKKYNSRVFHKQSREIGICDDACTCSLLEAEREQGVESLKSHLSEQRHDFFNLLQVLYGYTQLKKPDKVLAHIKSFCRQMENIGRLYNCKCIKLADLLYTKDKEAESIDLKLEVSAEVSFDPIVRMIDADAVLYIVDHAISGFLYAMDKKGFKNAHIIFELKEREEDFLMEIYCRELREGQLEAVSLDIPGQDMYWKKIERDIVSFDRLESYCRDCSFESEILEGGCTFVLRISKNHRFK